MTHPPSWIVILFFILCCWCRWLDTFYFKLRLRTTRKKKDGPALIGNKRTQGKYSNKNDGLSLSHPTKKKNAFLCFAFTSPQNRMRPKISFYCLSLPALCDSRLNTIQNKCGIGCRKNKQTRPEPIFYFLVVEIENREGAKGNRWSLNISLIFVSLSPSSSPTQFLSTLLHTMS